MGLTGQRPRGRTRPGDGGATRARHTPDTGTSGPSACPESSGCHGDRCFLKKQKIIFFTESKLFFLFLYRFSDVIFTFAPHLLVGRAIQWRHPCHPLVGGPRGVRSGATPTSQTSTRPGPVVRSRGPAVAAQLLVSLALVSCDPSETKAEPARDLGFAPQSVRADRVLGGLRAHTRWGTPSVPGARQGGPGTGPG